MRFDYTVQVPPPARPSLMREGWAVWCWLAWLLFFLRAKVVRRYAAILPLPRVLFVRTIAGLIGWLFAPFSGDIREGPD